jgi:DNA-binding SARP family transcriptional activator
VNHHQNSVKHVSKLHLAVRGFPQVLYQGVEIRFRTQKALALFIYLAVEQLRQPDRSIAREQLTDLLWPGMPSPSALQNLRQTIYQIRKALPVVHHHDGSEVFWLMIDRKSVRIHPQAPFELDIQEFFSTSQTSVTNYHHPENFLKDFYIPEASGYEEWVAQLREELRRRLLRRLESLYQEANSAHREQAISYARQLVQVDPLSEKYILFLMKSYVAHGQRTEALRAYQQFVQCLQEELGTAPSNQIRTFHEQLRTHPSSATRSSSQPLRHFTSLPTPSHIGRWVAGLLVLSLFGLLAIHLITVPSNYKPSANEAEANDASLPEEIASVHPQAYAWYQKGREAYYHSHPDSLQKAMHCFQTAMTIDPDFTLARVRIAMTLCTQVSSWGDLKIDEVYHEIQMHLEAIGRDPDYRSTYHMIKGWFYFWILDKEQAVQQLRRAVQINPDEEFGYSGLCLMLTLQGKYEEAKLMGLLGLEKNPHLFWNHFVMGNAYYYEGAFEQAVPYLQKALQMNPRHPASHIILSRVFAAQGHHQKAIDHLLNLSDSDPYMRGQLGVIYLQSGQTAYGQTILQEMKEQYAQGKKQQCYYIAMLYNTLGDTENALYWLEKSVAEKENELNWLEVDHEFRNLHDHPHFQRIVRDLPKAFLQNLTKLNTKY